MTRVTPTRGTGFLAAIASDARAPVRTGWMSLADSGTHTPLPHHLAAEEANKPQTPIAEPRVLGEVSDAEATRTGSVGTAASPTGIRSDSTPTDGTSPRLNNVGDAGAVREHSVSVETKALQLNLSSHDRTPFSADVADQTSPGKPDGQASSWRLHPVDDRNRDNDVKTIKRHTTVETTSSHNRPIAAHDEADPASSGTPTRMDTSFDGASRQTDTQRGPPLAAPITEAVGSGPEPKDNRKPAGREPSAYGPRDDRQNLSESMMRPVEIRQPGIGESSADNKRSGGEVHIGRVDITVVSSDPVSPARPAKSAKQHKAPAIRPESLHYVRRF